MAWISDGADFRWRGFQMTWIIDDTAGRVSRPSNRLVQAAAILSELYRRFVQMFIGYNLSRQALHTEASRAPLSTSTDPVTGCCEESNVLAKSI